MPTYEYACKQCDERLEVVQSFRDDPLTVCPTCEGELRKVFSASGIIFKGSGWHIKDYATSGASGSSSASEASGSSSGSEKAASSDGSASSSSSSDSTSSSDSSSSSGSGEAKSA